MKPVCMEVATTHSVIVEVGTALVNVLHILRGERPISIGAVTFSFDSLFAGS